MIRVALAVALLLCGSSASFAKTVEEDQQQLMQSAMADLQSGRPAPALKTLDRLLLDVRVPARIATIHQLRAIAFMEKNSVKDAVRAVDAAIAADPTSDFPAIWAFETGTDTGSLDIAMRGADRLLASNPSAARKLEGQKFFSFIRGVRASLGNDRADDYLLRFADVGWGEGAQDHHDGVASSAALVYLKRGKTADAKRLVSHIFDAAALAEVLTDRRFAEIWPEVESRIGSHMEVATGSSVISAENDFRDQPDSPKARQSLMHAYIMAGRLPDGDKVGAEFAKTPEAIAELDESGGWFVNEHAMLLYAMHRDAEADARYAALRAIDIQKSPWLISMVINRVEFLVRKGHYAKAGPLVDEAAALSEKYGSPYARQLVRRLRVCMAAGLKQPTEASLQDLVAHKADSRGVTAEGYLCVGKTDEAAQLTLAQIDDPEATTQIIGALQPPESVWDGDPSSWRAATHALLSRPDVKDAFLKIGRILPETYWPIRRN